MATVQKVARRIRTVIGKPYVGELVIGTDVPHAHVHLVAFATPVEMKRTLDGPGSPADDATLASVASKLYFE